MKAYIEFKNGFPVNVDAMCALQGFEELGYDIKSFEYSDVVSQKYRALYPTNPFAGSIRGMSEIFKSMGKLPAPIDFPESNLNLLGREVRFEKLSDAVGKFKANSSHVFIKPVKTKLFDGMVLSKDENLSYFEDFMDENCITSDKIDIVSEWRGFVYKEQLLDCRQYRGDFTRIPDFDLIRRNIIGYKNQPVSYTIDVAVLKSGKTVVIEFNDFWAIGSYGLAPDQYATMLMERYYEITRNL